MARRAWVVRGLSSTSEHACCLLENSRREADADKDGWIAVKELYDYSKPKVLDESRRLGYDQTLQFLPAASGARASTRLARTK